MPAVPGANEKSALSTAMNSKTVPGGDDKNGLVKSTPAVTYFPPGALRVNRGRFKAFVFKLASKRLLEPNNINSYIRIILQMCVMSTYLHLEGMALSLPRHKQPTLLLQDCRIAWR
jgi:hypothetical protein